MEFLAAWLLVRRRPGLANLQVPIIRSEFFLGAAFAQTSSLVFFWSKSLKLLHSLVPDKIFSRRFKKAALLSIY